jgi:hypothetical protein
MGRIVESKQSISEFEVEKRHIKPQQELSTAHMVRKAEYFHQHGEIVGRLKYSQTTQSQRTTQLILSHSNSYSPLQVKNTIAHNKWGLTRRNTGLRKLR